MKTTWLRAFVKGLIATSAAGYGTLMRVATTEPAIALTFDDGPDPVTTPQLLDLLEAAGARGTFFMVGKSARRHPELVRRVAEAGHAVGNHGWEHLSLPLLRGRGRRLQIEWTREALAPWGSRLFRPPYGHQSPGSHLTALRLGYQVVMGDVVAEDWRDDSAAVLRARIDRRLANGSIVLMHDALYTTVDEAFCDRRPTLEAVASLLEELGNRYRFLTVPELLRLGRPRRWHSYMQPDDAWMHRLL